MPLTVSDDGTVWNLHRAGVDPIEFAYENQDGTPVNLQADTVTFKVKDGPVVTLVANPASATDLLIDFSDADLLAMPKRTADFRIKNETTGQVLLFGLVSVTGIA